jgi:hypothetical protein
MEETQYSLRISLNPPCGDAVLTKSLNVERRIYEHGQKELVHFKTQIERIGEPGVAANTTPIVQSLRR